MNLKKGLIRLSVVLTVSVGIYGYLFNKTQIWDESYFLELKEKALLEKYSSSCGEFQISSVTELGTNRRVYYITSKGSDFTRRVESVFDLPIVWSDGRCQSLLLLIEKNNIETSLLISNITEDNINDYISKYRSDSRSAYIKSRVYAVLKAVAYLWMTIALLSAMFFALRWVYKGFKNYDK